MNNTSSESSAPATTPLPGLMMDFPLTVQHIARRMRDVHGSSRIVTLVDPETQSAEESTFRDLIGRAGRVANALSRLGIGPGDRVGSLAWNTTAHLEVYFGVMSMGAVLHTLNLRLHADQLAFTVNHAEDRVIIVEADLLGQLVEVLPRLRSLEQVIVIGSPEQDTGLDGAVNGKRFLDYEELLAGEPESYAWPPLDEHAAASLCYTSGTTGDPKGVLYSHRSIVLHALTMTSGDSFGISSRDRVLALVPLFHAMGWGLPFVCGMSGADLVLPGRHVRPAPVAALIEREQATWSAGVPTLWLDLLTHLDAQGSQAPDISSLHTVLCGGTAVPLSLMQEYRERFGVDILQGWGMTEVFPGVTVVRDRPGDTEEERWHRRTSAGRLAPLYELRLVDSEGDTLPHDGEAVGEFQIRGPAVAGAYYAAPEASAEKRDGSWLRTGDIGTLDPAGWMRITDRAKDAIKSGGEWISSLELETALMAHPAVQEAAVIGRPDPRWSERPLAYVVTREQIDPAALSEFLAPRVARWWIPEEYVFVEDIPRTSTGKFDKRALRTLLEDGEAPS